MEKSKLSRSTILFLAFCLFASALISIYLSSANQNYRNQDFFTFWLGGHMSATGQDVYDQNLWVGNHTAFGSTWIENPYYVYPLSTALLTTPFGLMNIAIASSIWLFFSFLAIIAGSMLMLSLWKKVNWQAYLIPIILGAFLFRPTFLSLLTGQIDGFLFCLLACAVFLFCNGKKEVACLLLAFLILKPNIGGPILAILVIYAIIEKKWRETIILTGSTLAILLFPLFYDPNWIKKYFFVGFHKSADNNLFPNLRGLAGLLTHESPLWTTMLWAFFSLIIVVGLVLLLRKQRNKLNWGTLMTFVIPVALLITPYLRAYDLMLLLIPILEITRRWANNGMPFLKINLVYLCWSLLAFALLFLAVALNHDIFSVGLSILVLTILCLQSCHSSPSLTISGS
jgi:hypothetical protein